MEYVQVWDRDLTETFKRGHLKRRRVHDEDVTWSVSLCTAQIKQQSSVLISPTTPEHNTGCPERVNVCSTCSSDPEGGAAAEELRRG